MLDSLATRYHLLPSQVLEKSDTLDILVMDVASAWHIQQREKAEAEAQGKVAPAKLSQDTMKQMIERVKNNASKNKQQHNQL